MSRLCMKGVLQPHLMHRSSFFLQHPHLPLMTSKYKNLPGIGGWQPFEDGSQALVVVEDEAVVKDERQPVCIALDKVGGGEAQRQIDLVGGAAADLFKRDQLPDAVLFKYRPKESRMVVESSFKVSSARSTEAIS